MTYPETIRFLYGLRLHGLKLGLENTQRLAGWVGRPQDRLRFIHVAGTNGKGSTCAMLDSIYRRAGLRVGLFTSPHLVSFRERVQVDRRWITEAEVVAAVEQLRPLLDRFPSDHPPTFFEVVTVLALCHFAERHCDLVIWETGMGGRLDATNIVQPLASLITNIQLDHQQWLGSTRAAIAAEKAGIIKPGVPALTTTDDPEALAVIRQAAAQLDAPLSVVPDAESTACGLPSDWPVPLQGRHQRTNAALALATVRALQTHLPVADRIVQEGLASVQWPGRMQLVRQTTGPDVLLDAAHNLSGMEALLRTLTAEYPQCRPAFILGMLRDKDWEAMGALAASQATRIFLVPVQSERSASPDELAAACQRVRPDAVVIPRPSLAAALAAAHDEPLVVVAGSLYLVGEATELLGLAPENTRAEHELNEWLPAKTDQAAPSPAAASCRQITT
jgi:dihydrofolate synthase / folylpolyglutamate synthase